MPLGAASLDFKSLGRRWHAERNRGPAAFSFARDAGGQVIVRKNFADYPAQNGRPAERHDDLLVIFREGGAERAIYWDSEGHIVTAPWPSCARYVVFESDDPAGPRYRITYPPFRPTGLEEPSRSPPTASASTPAWPGRRTEAR